MAAQITVNETPIYISIESQVIYVEENYGWVEFDARISLRPITLEFVLSTSLVVLSQMIQKPKDMFHRYLVTAIVFPIIHEGVKNSLKNDTGEVIIPKSKPKRRKLSQVSKTVKCWSNY